MRNKLRSILVALAILTGSWMVVGAQAFWGCSARYEVDCCRFFYWTAYKDGGGCYGDGNLKGCMDNEFHSYTIRCRTGASCHGDDHTCRRVSC